MAQPELLNANQLTHIAYGINGAGGGGNVLELYNPQREMGIIGLVEEVGNNGLRLVSAEQLDPHATVCCVARLGKPGAKADQYGQLAAEAIVEGLQTLSTNTKRAFPSAIFPVEATAGQMARAYRAAVAASKSVGKPIHILDGDVCGGLAVPSVPLAFGIEESLRKYPEVALIELRTIEGEIKSYVSIITDNDPLHLEDTLRKFASDAEFGAVWFSWLLSPANEFNTLFTSGAISSSLKRGQVIETAIDTKRDIVASLRNAGEITREVTQGVVTHVQREEAPGFAQFSYQLDTSDGPVSIAARNEYIVVYQQNNVLSRAPNIVNLIGPSGPIQTHILKVGDAVHVIEAQPQCLMNHPEKKSTWLKTWKKYWDRERKKGVWHHPY